MEFWSSNSDSIKSPSPPPPWRSVSGDVPSELDGDIKCFFCFKKGCVTVSILNLWWMNDLWNFCKCLVESSFFWIWLWSAYIENAAKASKFRVARQTKCKTSLTLISLINSSAAERITFSKLPSYRTREFCETKSVNYVEVVCFANARVFAAYIYMKNSHRPFKALSFRLKRTKGGSHCRRSERINLFIRNGVWPTRSMVHCVAGFRIGDGGGGGGEKKRRKWKTEFTRIVFE